MLQKLNNLPVRARLAITNGTLCVLALALAVGGLVGMENSAERLKTVYENRIVPMEQLAEITRRLQDDKLLIMQANARMAAGEAVNADAIVARVNANRRVMDRRWEEYMAMPLSPEEKDLAAQFVRNLETYRTEGFAASLKALQAFNTTDFTFAYSRSEGLFPMVNDGIGALFALQMSMSKDSHVAAMDNYVRTRNVMVGALVAGLGLALVFSLLIARSITGPVDAMQAALVRAAQSHDLTQRVPVSGTDEIGRMGQAFNTLMQALQDTLKKVIDGAHEVSSAASEMALASGQITHSARAQTEAAASTAAAVEQVTVSIGQVAENARETKAVSEQASAMSESGEATARETATQMVTTTESVAASMRMIESLSQRSDDISGIVKVIRDIAEQTNLLALNAAIEAARAGEQGRGFAVVADEVRKLAERTSSSTSEISTMIEAIQGEVRSAVGNLKANNEQVAAGRKLAEEVATTLSSINSGARTTMQRINEISSAASEQSAASNDIASNVEKIAQMSEETNAAVGQAAQVARQLEDLAARLHGDVARFKTH